MFVGHDSIILSFRHVSYFFIPVLIPSFIFLVEIDKKSSNYPSESFEDIMGWNVFFLQEDKEKLFDVVDTLKGVLPVANGTLSTLMVLYSRL